MNRFDCLLGGGWDLFRSDSNLECGSSKQSPSSQNLKDKYRYKHKYKYRWNYKYKYDQTSAILNVGPANSRSICTKSREALIKGQRQTRDDLNGKYEGSLLREEEEVEEVEEERSRVRDRQEDLNEKNDEGPLLQEEEEEDGCWALAAVPLKPNSMQLFPLSHAPLFARPPALGVADPYIHRLHDVVQLFQTSIKI